jgi:hypothetical protein
MTSRFHVRRRFHASTVRAATLTGRVSGRFSDDGRSISAGEVLSYLVVRTGEQVDVRC